MFLRVSNHPEFRPASNAEALGNTDHESDDNACQEKGGYCHNGPHYDLQDDHDLLLSEFLGFLPVRPGYVEPRLGIIPQPPQIAVDAVGLNRREGEVARPETAALRPHGNHQYRPAIHT